MFGSHDGLEGYYWGTIVLCLEGVRQRERERWRKGQRVRLRIL